MSTRAATLCTGSQSIKETWDPFLHLNEVIDYCTIGALLLAPGPTLSSSFNPSEGKKFV